MPLDEVIILDADENTVELPVVLNDLESMPEEVVSPCTAKSLALSIVLYGWDIVTGSGNVCVIEDPPHSVVGLLQPCSTES